MLKTIRHRKAQIIAGLILLIWLSWQVVTPAQTTTQLESRLSRIEFENTTLQAAINQLEAQVARLSSDAGIAFTPADPVRSAAPSALADDPTFKRLATLVIELKERVAAVEEQVAAIAPTP